MVSNTSTKDLLAKANARLVSSLSSNLALMDPFSKRSAVGHSLIYSFIHSFTHLFIDAPI